MPKVWTTIYSSTCNLPENGEDICPVCGAEEAVAFLPEEQKAEIITQIEAAERAAGRIIER
jgi:uncharacterized Zn finger protein (UPF0148 family)